MMPHERVMIYSRAVGRLKGCGFAAETLAILKDPINRYTWNGTWEVSCIITRSLGGDVEENIQTNYRFHRNILGYLLFWSRPGTKIWREVKD